MNSARPSGLERDAHERLGDRLAVRARRARRARSRGRRSSRRASRVSTYTPCQSSGGVFVVGGSAAARPGARGRRARRGARRAASGCSAAHAGARSKNVRCCRPKSRPIPRAVVCGRSSPPSARLLVDELEDLAEQLGAGVALREPERDRPAGAAVDLGHPVHLGARALVVRARTLEARRDFVHALAVPAEHVGDREQLALVGPRSGHGPAVGNAVQQRARRREAERAARPSPRRRDRTSPRCRRRSPASRRGCVRPSRSGAPRSARSCRRRSRPWACGRSRARYSP